MIKSIAKRFLPLFLALVVVISLFPAVPAFADEPEVASDYTVSGSWIIKNRPVLSFFISLFLLFQMERVSHLLPFLIRLLLSG